MQIGALSIKQLFTIGIIYIFYTQLFYEDYLQKLPLDSCKISRLKMQQVSSNMQKMSLNPAKVTKEKIFDSIKLYLCTWNVGGAGPPKDLTDLLGLKDNPLPDIYGIGFQEMDPRDEDFKDNMWTSRLTEELGKRDYVRIKVLRMQAISLQVFVKRHMLLRVTNIESEYSKAGMGGWWGNKGGVSIRFDVGGVNMIIVNTHLAAHMENMAERIEDFNTVIKTQQFRDPDVENILDHDYVFWMGDLNCRLENISKPDAEKAIQKKDFETLLKLDQLRRAQKEGLMLVDFVEGPITFKPTYKFDPNTDTYDTSEKQRVPAWCDRILYKVQTDLEGLKAKQQKYASPMYSKGDHKPVVAGFDVNQLHYKSHEAYKESDHKPMTAGYTVKIFTVDPCPFVTFAPISKWKYGKTQKFHYTIRKGIEPDSSPWDWIGLYKIDFTTFDEYETYVYGKNNAEDRGEKGVTLEIDGKYLQTPPGKYVLCYISKYKGWLRGMSNIFEIVA